MQILWFVRQTWNRFVAWLHLQRGFRYYQRGRFGRAAAHIHASLLRGGPSFRAHLLLGKIYLRLNRFDRARREFAQARFIDPNLFSAQGLPEDLLLEMAERFYQPLWRQSADEEESGRREPVPPRRERRAGHDDFSSASERARFQVLPPIRPEDIDDVNWEDLSSLLDE